MVRSERKIRYAVVGLGWFAQTAILPAFQNARDNSQLVALVSGDVEKATMLAEKYQVPVYHYDQYDNLLRNGEVDAVYIALPNSMHMDFTLRAANANVHVLCEKPMATNATEGFRMIEVCNSHGVKLMIAYRLHFEEANLRAVETIKAGKIGDPRLFLSTNTQQVVPSNTRLDAELGGGPLPDVGIYCINAARYLFQDEPVEVMAFAGDNGQMRFQEVPESVSALLRFPGGRVASFVCGFGQAKSSTFQVIGTEGDVRLDPAFAFHGELKQVLTIGEKSYAHTYASRDQVAPEILYFSDCILTGQTPEPSGQEGVIDLQIIDALHQSITENRPIAVGPFEKKVRPSLEQRINRQAVKQPELINAAPPSGAQ